LHLSFQNILQIANLTGFDSLTKLQVWLYLSYIHVVISYSIMYILCVIYILQITNCTGFDSDKSVGPIILYCTHT
jgi:hypothetical protein